MMIGTSNNRLTIQTEEELLWIEPYGDNSLRVRATLNSSFPTENGSLNEVEEIDSSAVVIEKMEEDIHLNNGAISVIVDNKGRLSFYYKKKCILKEKEFFAREYTSLYGGGFSICQNFEEQEERIYGCGYSKENLLDLKGSFVELKQIKNTCAVPFYISSNGYGILWNNASEGSFIFGKNGTRLQSNVASCIDYWITVGDNFSNILENYQERTGNSLCYPSQLNGVWLKAKNDALLQEENGINFSAIEIKDDSIIKSVKDIPIFEKIEEEKTDITNLVTRNKIKQKCMDNSENLSIIKLPLVSFIPSHTRLGVREQVENLYPCYYAKIYKNSLLKNQGKQVCTISPHTWSGMQKYISIVSLPKIHTFLQLQAALKGILNLSMSGFSRALLQGNFEDTTQEFRLRLLQFSVFSSVCSIDEEQLELTEENKIIAKQYLLFRKQLEDALLDAEENQKKGIPIMRPLWWDYPNEEPCTVCEDEYLFCKKYLVAPILQEGETYRKIYLPQGNWKSLQKERLYSGGQYIKVFSPLEWFPVFEKM